MSKWIEHIRSRHMGLKWIWILYAVFAGLFFLYEIITSVYEFDVFFLLATGEEIVKNGIPYENVWTIDRLGFVAQQWLYDVILYWFYSWGGRIGLICFVAIQCGILAFILQRILCRMRVPAAGQFIVLCLTMWLSKEYLFSVRPEAVTLILLAAECHLIEKAYQTNRFRLLYWLPVLTALEVNLHSSMWPFHFCILLAYLVPVFWHDKADNRMSRMWTSGRKQVVLSTMGMAASLFLNPYGLDGILYLFRSNLAGTFRFINIVEMRMPFILSSHGFMIVVCLGLVLWQFYKGYVPNGVVNMALGFGFLSMLAGRNTMFLLLPLFFLLAGLLKQHEQNGLQHLCSKWYMSWLFGLFLAAGILWQGYLLFPEVPLMFSGLVTEDTYLMGQLSLMCDYMEQEKGKDVRVFTGFNTGAYLEFEGYRQIYMDARPELHMQKLNGKRNVLPAYSRYAMYGVTMQFDRETTPSDWLSPVTAEEMEEWLSEYDFEYIIVMPSVEQNLAGWMMQDDTYQLVGSCSGGGLLLYEKGGI